MFFKNTYESFTLNIANYTVIFVESRKYTFLHRGIKKVFIAKYLNFIGTFSKTDQYEMSLQMQPIRLGNHQFACPVCSKVMPSAGNVRRHILIHTGEKPFKCHICKFACNVKFNLDQHIRTKHNLQIPYQKNTYNWIRFALIYSNKRYFFDWNFRRSQSV